MAKFNEPSGDEQVTGYNPLAFTRPIDQPKGNMAGEIRLKGLGQLGAEAADLFDKNQHDWLSQDIFNKAEPERQRMQASLDSDLAALKEGDAQLVPPTSTHQQQQTDILGAASHANMGYGASMPDNEKKEMTSDVEAIVGAKASGRLSMTDYYARLDKMAQSYRNAWPGEREFIDEQFNKFTGREIANRRMAATMSDINTFAAARREGQEKGLAFFENEKVRALLRENWDPLFTRFRNGDKTAFDQAQRIANPGLAADGQYELDKTRMSTQKMAEEEQDKHWEAATYNWAMDKTRAHLSALDTGGKDISPAVDQALKSADQPRKPLPEEVALQHALQAQRDWQQTNAEIDAELAKPDAPGSKVTVGDHISPDRRAKMYDDVKKIYQDRMKAYYDGNISEATVNALANTAMVNNVRSQLYRNNSAVLAAEAVSNLPDPLKTQVQTQILALAKAKGTDVAAQALTLAEGLNGVPGKNNKPPEIPDMIKAMQEDNAPAQAYLEGVKLASGMNSTKHADPTTFNNYVETLSSGRFQGTLNRFSVDRTDAHGVLHPGAYSLYASIYNPGVVENAKKFGVLDKVETAAKRDLQNDLFQRTYAELKDLGDHPEYKAVWDPDKHHIHFMFDPQASERLSIRIGIQLPLGIAQRINDAERNLNMGFDVLSNIAKAKGDPNIDEFLAEAMINSGADFSGLHFTGNLAQGFTNSFLHSRKMETQEEKRTKELQGEEDTMEKSGAMLGGVQ
jgi:hypothetical protein